MSEKARRGDYIAVREIHTAHYLNRGPETYERFHIARVIRANREGVATHFDRPYLYEGAKANGGTIKRIGQTVYLLGPYARDARLENLDGRDFESEAAMKAALREELGL